MLPGVGAHHTRAEFGRHIRYRGVDTTPGVVDQIGAGRTRQPGHLRAPGVDADQLVGVGITQPLDEGQQPGDLGAGVDVLPGSGFDAADIDDVGALIDGPVDGFSGGPSLKVAPLS